MRTECLVDPGADARLTSGSAASRCSAARRGRAPAAASSQCRARRRRDRWVPWDEAVEHEVDLDAAAICCRWPAAPRRALDHAGRRDESRSVLTTAARVVVGAAVRQPRPSTAWSGSRPVGRRRRPRSSRSPSTVENTPAGVGDGRRPRADAVRRSLLAVHTLLAVEDGASSRCSTRRRCRATRWPAAATTARSRCSSVARSRRSRPSCSRRRSSSTTTRPSRPRAPATSATPPRSTRSWPCGSSPSPTRRRPRPAAPTGAPRRSSTAATTMPPEVWERLHGASARSPASAGTTARAPARLRCRGGIRGSTPRSTPGRTPSWIGGVEVGKGTTVRLRPSRRADAQDLFLAGRGHGRGRLPRRRRRRARGRHVDDDPATEMLEWQRPLPVLPPRRGRGARMR